MSHVWRSYATHMKSHTWISHVTHMNKSCHTYGGAMPHIWMTHIIHRTEFCHTHGCIMSHIWRSHVTHMNESSHTYEGVLPHIWISHANVWQSLVTLIERNPPPRGGFLFTMFPHQRLCVRGPPSKNLYQVLRRGSSYTRFLMREHSK